MIDESLTQLITAFRSETGTGVITPESLGSLLQKIVDAVPVATTPSDFCLPPRYHVECRTQDNVLYMKGDVATLLEKGYIPYIFRKSVKRNRIMVRGEREYGPTRKGWNVFFHSGKIKVSKAGVVNIVRHNNECLVPSVKGTDPIMLFSNIAYELDDETGDPGDLRVAFGRRVYNCLHGHRFHYAIGFAPVQLGKNFDYSTLVTNLAEFTVYVGWNFEIAEPIIAFSV